MRVVVTEIEASAEELRQCTSLGDAMTRAFKNLFVLPEPKKPAWPESRGCDEPDADEGEEQE